MATQFSTLPGKSYGRRSLVGCSPWGLWRVRHDWATSLSLFTFLHWRRKWQPTLGSGLENPRDGGAWWAAVYGVAQSRTRLKRLSSSSNHLSGASPLPLDVGHLFLVGSNILLSMVVQQRVVILEFSQEKMTARPPTPPSWIPSKFILPINLHIKTFTAAYIAED